MPDCQNSYKHDQVRISYRGKINYTDMTTHAPDHRFTTDRNLCDLRHISRWFSDKVYDCFTTL